MTAHMPNRVAAVERLVAAAGLTHATTAADYDHAVTEQWTPRNGGRLCAKAWLDPEFKARLLQNGKATAATLGMPMPEHHGSLVVLENTPQLHNVICCTLCSCTGFTIIGMAPGWYKDLEYRARVVRDARKVLGELGPDARRPGFAGIRRLDPDSGVDDGHHASLVVRRTRGSSSV